MSRWLVVLAGGVGSRFWPLSTPQRPKQLLPLVTDRPLLAETLDRLAPIADLSRTLILTNATLASPIRALVQALPPENLIAEPRPAGTAAALAWAASEIARRDDAGAVMISVHADWAIGDDEGFRRALLNAAAVASAEHALVTIGVVPTRADTGFGYIKPGDAVRDGARRVEQFVEKPDRATAERMVVDGYLWNSGIFVWRVADFLEEVRHHTPEVAPALTAANGNIERFFAAARVTTVDVGVLERSSRVLVMPGDFGWDDVGTWSALHRVRAPDSGGNSISGNVHVLESRGNVVHADGKVVVLYGVDDLVVVAHEGLTLVTTRERSTDLKTLVESLPDSLRDQS